MKKLLKIAPLIILLVLSILLDTGRVCFGYGLGDIFYYALVYAGLCIYGLYFIFKKEKPAQISIVFPTLAMIFCGYLLLSMSIWRGVEYRWDGHILKPVSDNHKTKNNFQVNAQKQT